MKLKVLSSNSSGNAYILEDKDEILLIECGVSFNKIKEGINFDLNKVVGVILSHEHKDHSKSAKDIAKARLPIYSSKGTLDAIEVNGNVMVEGKVSKVGNFKVLPFSIRHDCAEPFGFVINHKDTGNILFATDTYYLPNRFANLSHIMIEANYSQEVIDKNVTEGSVSQFLRDRTMQSHMSIDTCVEALLANDLNKVRNIILLHLSDRNSNATDFKKKVEEATGKGVFIADKGLDILLNK